MDEYITESKAGDTVSGRIVNVSGDRAKVELGEGVFGLCKLAAAPEQARGASAGASKADLSTLSSMLSAKWKAGGAGEAAAEPLKAGQIRTFKISSVDPSNKKIELELI
jgi:small subunit ribosomal protein S1